jgi:hypothetical protein
MFFRGAIFGQSRALEDQHFGVARSERFELPTLGFEVRCSIQLSYERPRGRLAELVAPGYPETVGPGTSPQARSPQPGRPDRSEAGILAVVLADVACRALEAGIGRGAVIIGEAAGQNTRPVIMSEADFIRQSEIANMGVVRMVARMMVGPCLREARRYGQGAQQ